MTTAAQDCKAIRTALKAQGISNRKVSVRADNYSMGSSINIEIKDATIAMSTVKAAAAPFERIDRCEITGDILSGGNRFLHISYSTEASEQRAAPYVDAVREAMNAVGEEKTTCLVSITGTEILVGSDGFGFQLWNGTRAGMHVNTPECAARYVADYVAENAERELDALLADERDAELEARNAAEVAEIAADAYPALRLLA